MTVLRFQPRPSASAGDQFEKEIASKLGLLPGAFRDDYVRLVSRFLRRLDEPVAVEVPFPAWVDSLPEGKKADLQTFARQLVEATVLDLNKVIVPVAVKAAFTVAEARRQARELGIAVTSLPDKDWPFG